MPRRTTALAAALLSVIVGCTDKSRPNKVGHDNREKQTKEIIESKEVVLPELNNEEVADIAKKITVKIEGSSQGSGVLIRFDKGVYTVLTAWHVVSAVMPGEEIDIITTDNHRHTKKLVKKIQKLNNIDLAVINFSSEKEYAIAKLSSRKNPAGNINKTAYNANVQINSCLRTNLEPTYIRIPFINKITAREI